MILRSADGTIYKVHFRHWLPCRPTRVPGLGLCRASAVFPYHGHSGPAIVFQQSFTKRPQTQCFLHAGDCHVHPQDCVDGNPHAQRGPLTVAQARCSPRDVFTKARGRWVALGRALALKFPADATLRRELLADYCRQLLPRCEHKRRDGRDARVFVSENGPGAVHHL